MVKSIIGFVVCLALPFLAGVSGSQAKPGAWYAALQKPTWTPPNFLFPIAWTLLYFLMGVSCWIVWKQGGFEKQKLPLTLYLIQLLLNAAWSWVFFGAHQIGWGLVDISVLWVFILLTTVAFWRVVPVAGVLFLPYLLWVSFATVLNFTLWRMN